ncbi:MAG: hypothetical protein J5756_01455 [Clostridia bacterium]|nr:hypothetical protein [Clostridia bacterium]
MKKVFSIILTLIMVLSVFAGVTVFADDILFAPYTLQLTLEGYAYGMPAEDINVGIYELGYIASETRYHLEEADGTVAEGAIQAGIRYKLVFEMKLIKYVSLENLTKEKVYLGGGSKTASDMYNDGEWYVFVFKLNSLSAVLDSIDFYMEGYKIGTNVNDIVVYSDNPLITDCEAYFYFYRNGMTKGEADKVNVPETGELKGGIDYSVSIWFKVPEGITPFNMKPGTIRLHGAGNKVLVSRGASYFVNADRYFTGFELPNLDSSYTTVTEVNLVCSGYAFGKPADDIVVSAASEGIVISSVTVKKEVIPPEDDDYYKEFHGCFDSGSRYRVEVRIEAAEGYGLYDDLPKSCFLMDIGLNYYLSPMYYPSDDGYLVVCTLPVLDDPNYEPKYGAGFSITGYELGADISDISVTVDDAEIEVRNVDIVKADGEYCTGSIQEGIQYEVVITAFAPGGWQVSNIALVTLDNGTFSGVGMTLDKRIMLFRFALPVFGELIDDPGDPGNEQYDEIDSLDLSLTGYELGNDANDIGVTCDAENAVIRNVTVKTPEGEECDGPIEAGKRYQVTVTIFAPGGWGDKVFPKIRLDGVSPYSLNMETFENTLSFVYYVHALAAGDSVELLSDMDGDGEITVSDALRALRIAAKLDVAAAPKSTRSAILGDADRDGEITVSDALIVLRKAAKLA